MVHVVHGVHDGVHLEYIDYFKHEKYMVYIKCIEQ